MTPFTGSAEGPGQERAGFMECILWGLVIYSLTSVVVILGVLLGHTVFRPAPHGSVGTDNMLSCFSKAGGQWYIGIAAGGYYNEPGRGYSNTIYFPGYPMVGRAVAWATGLTVPASLLLVSHLCLAATFVVLAFYVKQRFPKRDPSLLGYVLVAMGLFPTSFFFRMTYSESLFVLLSGLFLLGIERKWPLIITALLVGAATSVRAVGVGLIPPLLLYIKHRSPSMPRFLTNLAVFLPVACWGIGGYMLFQLLAFGDPLLFYRSHREALARQSPGMEDKVASLAALEPLWTAYLPSSPGYWLRDPNSGIGLLNLRFANPILFLFAVVLTAVGSYKRWLSPYEVLLALSVLLIPYLATAYELQMAGTGRFAAAVLPIYLVLGKVCCRLPPPVSACLWALSGVLAAAYAGMFASSYHFY